MTVGLRLKYLSPHPVPAAKRHHRLPHPHSFPVVALWLGKSSTARTAPLGPQPNSFSPRLPKTPPCSSASPKYLPQCGWASVVDTSRNGLGSNGEWRNPEGRAVGQLPTTKTKDPLVDALIWGKVPGESDGTCNGGPNAGEFWLDQALSLVRNANWSSTNLSMGKPSVGRRADTQVLTLTI